MKNRPPLWTSLLSSPRYDDVGISPLKAALLTTYKPPDSTFLVENFLPDLLGMESYLSDDFYDYYAFRTDLIYRLTRIPKRITIISSMDQEIDQNNPWLNHYIDHLIVGKENSEVQHAKLWLLHRAYNEQFEEEALEIYVSSANLTMSSFKEQIQAAWRAIIPLSYEGSQSNLNTWGIVPEFLKKLGKSSGGSKITDYFVNLLKRAKAPEDVTFLASVPGNHSDKDINNKLWGTRGLRKVKPSGKGSTKIRIFVPIVGIWDQEKLEYWIQEAGGNSLNDLTIAWINKGHLWAAEDRWQMSDKTFKNMMNSGVIVKCLPGISDKNWKKYRFHEKQLQSDPRWSHAKIYDLQRGNEHRIIITSANFSPSAWGSSNKNVLRIENFEFGVALNKFTNWNLKISELENIDFYNAWVNDQSQENQNIGIAWAQVTWDGEEIVLRVRTFSSDLSPSEEVLVCSKMEQQVKTKWNKKNRFWIASINWNKTDKLSPNFVKLTCESKTWTISVIDQRSIDEISNIQLSGIDDPEKAQEMRDALLLEQYGGNVVESDSNLKQQSIGDFSPTNKNDDYSLPSFIQARKWFGILDNWAKKFENLPSEYSEIIKQDGKNLIEVFRRKEKKEVNSGTQIAAKLIADEIQKRLKG